MLTAGDEELKAEKEKKKEGEGEEVAKENKDEDPIDKARKKFQNRSMYELAKEMKNEWCSPSIDSYGETNVFISYKNNKWFDSVDII